MTKKLTIAIDGYSACGKSTLAKDLAEKLNYVFIDSGAMYRAVTLFAIENAFIQDDTIQIRELIDALPQVHLSFQNANPKEKAHIHLNHRDVELEIRKPYVAQYVSKIAAIKEVRQKLVKEQHMIGKNGGVIMDGRDIGTVVFPEADLKLFVTADNTVRAERRFIELTQSGVSTSLEEVLKNLEERDAMDINRSESPLIQASDAILIDTTNHTRESQLEFVLQLIDQL